MVAVVTLALVCFTGLRPIGEPDGPCHASALTVVRHPRSDRDDEFGEAAACNDRARSRAWTAGIELGVGVVAAGFVLVFWRAIDEADLPGRPRPPGKLA